MSVAQAKIAYCPREFPDEPLASRSVSYSQPLVAVLLCTYNGDNFLAEQLDSIASQTHKNLDLWASDDGSQDKTQDILKEYQSSWLGNRFSIRSGPQQGFAGHFLSLICNSSIQADYFACSDQDDIWEPEKLERALTKLNDVPGNLPALYCSRTIAVDEHGHQLGLSPLFQKPPSFANALVQNIGGGNTMIMNQAARELLLSAGSQEVASHDWWLYLLVSGAGGKVFYDATPSVQYRQHDNNLVGSNTSWLSRLHRIRVLFQGRFRRWNTINTQALVQNRKLLTPENQHTLDTFCSARNRWLVPRLSGMWKSGIYRQTRLGTLGLIVATLFKKL